MGTHITQWQKYSIKNHEYMKNTVRAKMLIYHSLDGQKKEVLVTSLRGFRTIIYNFINNFKLPK